MGFSVHDEAAVHRQHLSGNKACALAEQEERSGTNVLRHLRTLDGTALVVIVVPRLGHVVGVMALTVIPSPPISRAMLCVMAITAPLLAT